MPHCDNDGWGEGLKWSSFQGLPPTRVRLYFYRRDVVVAFNGGSMGAPNPEPPERNPLGPWSRKSRKKLLFLANNCGVEWLSLLTLTYPECWPTSGRVCARHLHNFFRAVERIWPGFRYLWVREFQRRGAPHWHILFDHAGTGRRLTYRRPEGFEGPPSLGWVSLHRWASRRWQETIADFGTPAGIRAGIRWEELRSKDGGAAYIARYAGKREQKTIPWGFEHPGRWWSPSNDVAARIPEHSVEITFEEYLNGIDGKAFSDEGFWYTTLFNGRESCRRWLPGDGQQRFSTIPPWEDQ